MRAARAQRIERAWRVRRVRQVLWAATGVAGLAGFVAYVLSPMSQPRPKAMASPIDANVRDLLDVLRRLRRSWQPGSRAAMLVETRAVAERLADALVAYLARPGEACMVEAVSLAEFWNVSAARPALLALAAQADTDLASQAVQAANRLSPLSFAELGELLGSDQPTSLIAALRVLTKCEHAHNGAILELLAHDDMAVRAAARRALPSRLDDQSLALLDGVLQRMEPEVAAATLATLRRNQWSDRLATLLLARLEVAYPTVRCAALSALTGEGRALASTEPIWRRVVDSQASPRERALAVFVLECSGSSAHDDDLVHVLPSLPVLVRYFAARRLLLAERPEGPATLLEVITRSADGDDANIDEIIQSAARRVLAQLTGTDPFVEPDVWRACLARGTPWLVTALASPEVDLCTSPDAEVLQEVARE